MENMASITTHGINILFNQNYHVEKVEVVESKPFEIWLIHNAGFDPYQMMDAEPADFDKLAEQYKHDLFDAIDRDRLDTAMAETFFDSDCEPCYYPDDMHDDAEALASAGWGTDEDYGYYGEDDY